MRKVLGIMTQDFRLYHDLVAALKARDIPFASLSFAKRVPESVGVVLTSPAEASRIRGPHVAVDDIEGGLAKALQLLRGKSSWREILIGVDPGREPGFAVIGDGEVIDTRLAESPEAVLDLVRRSLRTFPADRVKVRVGHGDPTNRNRIFNALAVEDLRVEVVDEAGTTRRTAQPDVDAAIDIARTPGIRAVPPFEVHPTRGELREIQRRSRLGSEGEVTISLELAAAVARGEVSLDEAIASQRRRDRRSQD